MESRRRAWIRNAIGWDGVLPVLVALSPEVAMLAIRDRARAAMMMMVLVPVPAALFRAHRGERQIQSLKLGHPAWGRQVVLAIAIMVLLASEFLLTGLQGARRVGVGPWLVAAGLYAAYLSLVLIALRPPRDRVRLEGRHVEIEPDERRG